MIRRVLALSIALLALTALAALGQSKGAALLHQRWFEARTAHFQIYSCSATQEVARLAARLEQFRDAYALLAGAQAVASPPIIVLAFPSDAALRPFLPLYQGNPENLSGFFHRGSDENLIVLHLSGNGSLERVFHEYAHLLMRHHQAYWPLWLNEGMAEIYSPFEVVGPYRTRIGEPLPYHLRGLSQSPLMPLHQLFAVTRDSAEYNERQHQGLFYAQSWLLTHYLMLGGNPAHAAGFRQLTPLLRQGQLPEQAFTNALHTTLPALETELRRYLAQGKFQPLDLTVAANLATPHAMSTRTLTPTEVCFHLGDELLRIGRLDDAESYFAHALKLAPTSPLPYEGLGLLAARRRQPQEAVQYLRQAARRGSLSFLSHYLFAQELLTQTGSPEGNYTRLDQPMAAEIRAHLGSSLALMPNFAPAHHLLGFFELLQGQNLAAAESQLAAAIQLEPENQGYLLTLAQVQLARHNPAAARGTLRQLCLPYVQPHLRSQAQQMLHDLAPLPNH
jgi:tetratricopeptide (TPR) repeat protein